MKTIEISDEEYDFLKGLVENLKTQDNRFTSDPIYLVQEQIKVPTDEDYGSDGTYYLETISGDYSQYESIFEAYRNLLESGYSKEEIRGRVEVINYIIEWKTIQSCFTEEGANWFINRKKHDYNLLRTYVDSLYYNQEMKQLRNLFLNLTLE